MTEMMPMLDETKATLDHIIMELEVARREAKAREEVYCTIVSSLESVLRKAKEKRAEAVQEALLMEERLCQRMLNGLPAADSNSNYRCTIGAKSPAASESLISKEELDQFDQEYGCVENSKPLGADDWPWWASVGSGQEQLPELSEFECSPLELQSFGGAQQNVGCPRIEASLQRDLRSPDQTFGCEEQNAGCPRVEGSLQRDLLSPDQNFEREQQNVGCPRIETSLQRDLRSPDQNVGCPRIEGSHRRDVRSHDQQFGRDLHNVGYPRIEPSHPLQRDLHSPDLKPPQVAAPSIPLAFPSGVELPMLNPVPAVSERSMLTHVSEHSSPYRSLQRGQFVQAVLDAGPLLKTLMNVGPLPQWRVPPPAVSSPDMAWGVPPPVVSSPDMAWGVPPPTVSSPDMAWARASLGASTEHKSVVSLGAPSRAAEHKSMTAAIGNLNHVRMTNEHNMDRKRSSSMVHSHNGSAIYDELSRASQMDRNLRLQLTQTLQFCNPPFYPHFASTSAGLLSHGRLSAMKNFIGGEFEVAGRPLKYTKIH